jgi:hypothetical protein
LETVIPAVAAVIEVFATAKVMPLIIKRAIDMKDNV